MAVDVPSYTTQPVLYRLENRAERVACEQAMRHRKGEVVDTLEEQLVEWLVTRTPALRQQPDTLAEAIQREIGEEGWEAFGTWAWFPWRQTWVRLLPESAFVAVRTNRNRNKITSEEQAQLATKCVGIAGLSVGSALAMTLAMERICGKLKLADYDALELSNLNRIQTGVHHLGVPKAVAIARAIAEVDPYFEVELFQEGFTPENAEAFMNGLDFVCDACDQVRAKANLRWHAKAKGIPLVMETSDRGMLDIERYDEAGTPFLHGRISDAMLEEMRSASTWKPEFFDAFIDVTQASARGVGSLQAVGTTLVGWPQLYTDVAAGGAHAAQVIRSVFLGEHIPDARHYLEWNEQLLESVN
jgi:molybdopterin/thiamine biosynthesis adenylyltransferase